MKRHARSNAYDATVSKKTAKSSCKVKLGGTFFRGNNGALRIPLLSFQFLRRPGCAAKLRYFHTAGGFESHPLRHSFIFSGLDSFLKLIPKKSSKSPAAQYQAKKGTQHHGNFEVHAIQVRQGRWHLALLQSRLPRIPHRTRSWDIATNCWR